MGIDYLEQAKRWADQIRSQRYRQKVSDERILQIMDDAIEYWLTKGQLRMFRPKSWHEIGEYIQMSNAFRRLINVEKCRGAQNGT